MKSKKLLLGSLSAMALVATPIATVVSCDKDTPAAAKITKMVKTNAKGFFIHEHFIPEALASKAGQVMFEGHKYVWDKPLKERQTIQVFESKDAKAKDYNSVLQADDKHFVLPLNGQSGVGYYFTKEEIKRSFDQHLMNNSIQGVIKFNLDLPTETKDGNTIVTKAGIKNLNTLLEITGLKVKSVSAEVIAKKDEMPKHTKYKITWVNDAPTTVAELKTQFESLTITGTATTITANNTASTTALANLGAIQAAAGTGVTLALGAGKTLSIPKGFTVTFKGITAFDSNGHSNLTLTLTKIADSTTEDVNIHISKVSSGPSSTTVQDNADITAVKVLFTTAAITGANTSAVTAVTTAGTTGITAMPTIAGVTWTHTFPTPLNGVKVTVKSIAAVAATSGATGNIVLELTKGTGTAQTVTIAITHA